MQLNFSTFILWIHTNSWNLDIEIDEYNIYKSKTNLSPLKIRCWTRLTEMLCFTTVHGQSCNHSWIINSNRSSNLKSVLWVNEILCVDEKRGIWSQNMYILFFLAKYVYPDPFNHTAAWNCSGNSLLGGLDKRHVFIKPYHKFPNNIKHQLTL